MGKLKEKSLHPFRDVRNDHYLCIKLQTATQKAEETHRNLQIPVDHWP